MTPDPLVLERLISEETGLEFKADTHMPAVRQTDYLLRPSELSEDESFLIRVSPGWRRLRIRFEPGKFAGELLSAMANADQIGRAAFRSILDHCARDGAEVSLKINGSPVSYDSPDIWSDNWSRFSLTLNKGPFELGIDEGESDKDLITRWTVRFASAVVAILPVEEEQSDPESHLEGAVTSIRANRYERDRRNRAAAISIHGCQCKACGLDLGERYGQIANGFIEVHHVIPVSQVGPDYQVDPAKDLVPLCPNCHAVAHRRDPPLSVGEIRKVIRSDVGMQDSSVKSN